MKKLTFLTLILITLAIGGFLYNDICESSPECACKNASPGDVTCTGPEQLKIWCDKQKSKKDLPQCHL